MGLTQEYRRLKSSLKFTDLSSQMDTELSFWLRVDSLTWDAPLVTHLSSCLAHSQTRLLLKLISGKIRTPTNTRRVRSTNFQRSLTRKSLDFTCQLFKLN